MAEKWEGHLYLINQIRQAGEAGREREERRKRTGAAAEPEAAQASGQREKKGGMGMRLVTLASGLTGREAASYGSSTGLAVAMHGMRRGEGGRAEGRKGGEGRQRGWRGFVLRHTQG